MKARLPPSTRITQKEKQAVYEYAQQEVARLERDSIRRFIKLMCYVLNQEFGFGAQRCLKITNGIAELSKEHERDEIFWHHVDRAVIDGLKIDFEREKMK